MNGMTTSLRRTLWAAGIAALLLATVAEANPGRGASRRARFARAVTRLDLSAEQRSQVRGIFERHRGAMRSERETLRAGRRAQFDAVHGAAFDEERIRAAVASAARAHADLVVTRARIAEEVRALLDAEQRGELDEMLAEARTLAERRRKMRDEGRRPR